MLSLSSLLEMILCLALLLQGLLLLSIDFACIFEVELQYITDWPMIVIFVDKWKLDGGLINK